MEDRQIKLIIGSLLHDIGKIVYRAGDGRQHSVSGYEFLKENNSSFDKDILDCVRYHHSTNLKKASIDSDALAYITYFADNVAAAMDRRESAVAEDGFDRTVPLDSVFNILNGNNCKAHYRQRMLNPKAEINYPTEEKCLMEESFYQEVVDQVKDNLKGIEISEEYVNSLLSVLEATTSFIPSSTSKRELTDISLFDHVKMTAAVAECCYQYMKENKILDYKDFLYNDGTKKLWEQQMFLLYSMDMSGIQSFIYTIGSKGALRGLRARSFYLELIIEHIIDELLDKLSLSRSCLIYSGGGHCYMLLPNTMAAKDIINKHNKEMNSWFIKNFDIALYIADGYAQCNASNLKNEPQGSYSNLFKTVSKTISKRKTHRYSTQELIELNSRHVEGREECCICRRMARIDGNGRCPTCAELENLSGDILYKDYFIIMNGEQSENCLQLPGDRYLVAGEKSKLLKLMDSYNYVRSYTVNDSCTGKHVTTKLWVGRYTTGDTFEELARKAEGIERIAVMRGDVDNLGQAFVNGFKDIENGKYETISRTSTLSRQLSMFFKLYLNRILEKGSFSEFSNSKARQACIVYSGGDDIFIVGAWNDVVASFVDVRNAFEKFTEGALTISGGIGIYDANFPINRMALEVARLEEYSKVLEDKDAITLFDETGRYKWNVFTEHVVNEKYKTIYDYMTLTNNRGKAFLYHLLELLRDNGERFNRARFVYYLSRMEPDSDEDMNEKMAYQAFSKKMYTWSLSEEERRQVVSAIYLYVYMQREKEGAE